MKKALCRPDGKRWCTECCVFGCPLLGDTGDGKRGCLGHNGKRTEGLTERPICLELDCLEGFSQKDRKTIREAILRTPPGEFKISEVLAQFKVGRRVCAWCDPPRVIGKKLGIDGDTHTICEDCQRAERWK